ncbi:MAG: hypothetical protein Mars2KO_20150 [Maribacter sp.]
MDKITDFLAKKWLRLEDSLDKLLQKRLVGKFNSTFLFFIGFIASIGLLFALLPIFNSVTHRILFFLGYVLIAFTGLTVAGTYSKKKALRAKQLYPFVFKKLNLNLVNYELLKFDEQEKIDFGLLLNRRRVQNKINFKEMNKSKQSASHPKLFSMFHVILEDGISELKDERLKLFFKMLQDSFLMNGKDINFSTLPVSFTNWNGDLKSKKIKEYNQYYQEIFKIE